MGEKLSYTLSYSFVHLFTYPLVHLPTHQLDEYYAIQILPTYARRDYGNA